MGIGDEVMVTGHVRRMQMTDPRKVRLVYERPNHWSEVFNGNPRIAARGEAGDFQLYQPRVNGLRPYIAAKTDRQWTWRDDAKPEVGELYFSHSEKAYASQYSGDVILEPNCKPKASPNKDWGWERWQKLAHMLIAMGIKPRQLGPKGTKTLNGVKLIETPTFRDAAVVLSRSRVAILPEGGLHHAAAAVGCKSVVIFGGYISPQQTGYDTQVNLFTGDKPCGWRLPCKHCAEAMQQITPALVLEKVKEIMR